MDNGIQAIVMPKLGLSMTEGMVAKWYVEAGARVAPGDIIAEIETSKITNELEVHNAGVIRGELAETEVELPVGALLCVIANEAATAREIEAFIAGFVPADSDDMEVTGEAADDIDDQEHKAVEVAAETEARQSDKSRPETTQTVPESLQDESDDSAVPATHLARKLAKRLAINLNTITGTGRRGRISKQDIEQAILSAGGEAPAAITASSRLGSSTDDSHIPATPLARRLAKQAGINLADVTATGPRGRVTKTDVETAIAAKLPVSTERLKSDASGPAYNEIALTPMRRTIAKRLTPSKQNAPHFRLTIDANIDQLLKLRADLNHNTGMGKISINDVLVKAVAETLIKVSAVNIQFDGNVIRRFNDADVAVAVALDDGLLTPIVRAADKKSIMEISREIAALSERAKSGALTADEFQGGTFTVSNLGMFGIKAFDAIINPPQAAILAVGAGEKRRILLDDEVVTATMLTATMSCDHRVIDGASGARFMQALKELLEHPYKLLI